MMFIIAGLGNPDRQYEGTRHNVGFDVIDRMAEKYNIDVGIKKHRALIGKGIIKGQKAILAKPQTYMNLSGESIGSLVEYYTTDVENELIIIYDDVSLGVGEKPRGYDLADYVLGHFSKAERVFMEEGYENAVHAAEMIVQGEIQAAMNEYNRKKKEE